MAIILYGIPNCDTVKKARKYLDSHPIDYQFHDFRKQGLTPETVQHWCEQLGWEAVLNKRSTSWRALDEADKADLNADKAITLMLAQPTLIKRPVLDINGQYQVGFKDADYQQALQNLNS